MAKILSMRQPWAYLVISGKKKIETRIWNTKYRGELYIHASKTIDLSACKKYKIDPKTLTSGAVIGKVIVEDVKAYKDDEDFLKESDKHLVTKEIVENMGWKNKPKFGFIGSNPTKIKPIFMKGCLGIFNAKI